jgi:hypothetical protein
VPADAVETRPVAELTLDLEITRGDDEVTPPTALVTGTASAESDLRELRTGLDGAARRAFASSDVVVDEVQFTDVAEGRVTAVLAVVTQSTERLTVEQLASGLTSLTDHSQGPFQAYLRKVTHESDLKVAISESYVERQEPGPSTGTPPPTPALTRPQQILARWITGLMLVPVTIFVLVVLDIDVWPFSIVTAIAGS